MLVASCSASESLAYDDWNSSVASKSQLTSRV